MDIAGTIRELRVAAGLTQAQLARKASTSQPAIARYERGAASPSVATFERIIRATGNELQFSTQPAPAADLSSQRAIKVRRERQMIRSIAGRHGATNVRIFGSVARGLDRAESDIDFLVDFDSAQGLMPITSMTVELEALLGEAVDVIPVDQLEGAFLAAALSEAVPL